MKLLLSCIGSIASFKFVVSKPNVYQVALNVITDIWEGRNCSSRSFAESAFYPGRTFLKVL